MSNKSLETLAILRPVPELLLQRGDLLLQIHDQVHFVVARLGGKLLSVLLS